MDGDQEPEQAPGEPAAQQVEQPVEQQAAGPLPPAGWYPHPTMAATRGYWDGQKWTGQVAPDDSTPAPGRTGSGSVLTTGQTVVAIIVLMLVIVGIAGYIASSQQSACAERLLNAPSTGPLPDC